MKNNHDRDFEEMNRSVNRAGGCFVICVLVGTLIGIFYAIFN